MNRFVKGLVFILALVPTVALAQALQWSEADGGNGHWYQVVTTPSNINWNDASAAASTMSLNGELGYLVTITSSEENAWILSNLQMGDVWTGAIQAPLGSEPLGGWGWVTGEPWTFSNWCSSEPANSGGNEDRLTITYSWSRCPGGWNDAHQYNVCSGYLVEWNPQTVSVERVSWGELKAVFGAEDR